MSRFRLIRFRLTLTYTIFLASAFALFSLGILFGLNHILNDNYDQKMQAAADQIVSQYSIQPKYHTYPTYGVSLTILKRTVGGDQAPLATDNYTFLDSLGRPIHGQAKSPDPKITTDPKLKQTITKSLTSDTPQSLTVKGNNGDTNLIVYPTGADQAVLVFESSRQGVEDTINLMKEIMLLAVVVMTFFSAIGAWILTGRVLRPIDRMSERVRRISIRDLSERFHMDQPDELGRLASTFDDMIARLQASVERQKRFTSDASHELRTPLTVMQADIDLALRRPRTVVEYRGTLESAQEEVTRLSRIVSDLLVLTRLDTDAAFVEHEPVALDELLDSVVSGLQPLARDRDINLNYWFSAPVTIMGDVTRLKQLFINLLDNALKYTSALGEVRVALESLPDAIHIIVSDTGMGIGCEHLPHIFERFYRTEQARARSHEGTGLGLAIAKSAVQAHHGDIDVVSRLGFGTTFTVTLPRSGVLAPEQPESARLVRLPLPIAI
jgi:heavy metal sensor kinase